MWVLMHCKLQIYQNIKKCSLQSKAWNYFIHKDHTKLSRMYNLSPHKLDSENVKACSLI